MHSLSSTSSLVGSSVYCFGYDDYQAESIVYQLWLEGFPSPTISLMRTAEGSNSRGWETGAPSRGTEALSGSSPAERSFSPFAPAQRSESDTFSSSGVLTGLLGWFAGYGLLRLHKETPVLVAGPNWTALHSYTGDTLAEALHALGLSLEEANSYAGRLANGEALIAVHVDTPPRERQARDLFERFGGTAILSVQAA